VVHHRLLLANTDVFYLANTALVVAAVSKPVTSVLHSGSRLYALSVDQLQWAVSDRMHRIVHQYGLHRRGRGHRLRILHGLSFLPIVYFDLHPAGDHRDERLSANRRTSVRVG